MKNVTAQSIRDRLKVVSACSQKDMYKTDHRRQYPDKSETVYSTWTPRSAKHFAGSKFFDKKVVVFGIQHFIMDYLIREFDERFFSLPKEEAVGRYKRRLDTSLGKGAVPVPHIEELYDLGYLPLEIKALHEGSRVDIRVPMATIKNTLPKFFWLTNDVETVWSTECWKPSTVATIAFEFRRLLEHYAEMTGSPLAFVPFQGHDFSMRGMSGRHDAASAGAGHLLSFFGTDTMPAIDLAEVYYFANAEEELIGTSVYATEHSVMCMGSRNNEFETFKRLITEVYPSGIVSIVSDTWNLWQVIHGFLPRLKDEILARPVDANGNSKVVIRPDSGDPEKILCGYDKEDPTECYTINGKWFDTVTDKELSEHELLGVVRGLWEVFGGTVNEKGYKMLDSHIGAIYGDSINLTRADSILANLVRKGFASSNVVFGIGSFQYQYITRDTFGFAVKATYGEVDGVGMNLLKDPITDDGMKKSATGLIRVEKIGDEYVLHEQQTPEQEQEGELVTVFKDGKLTNPQTFSEIRERLLAGLPK